MIKMTLTGRIWIFDDDDINTDVIFPGKYTYKLLTDAEMAQYAMEDYDPAFAKKVQAGDIIIAGKNYGCGSSREQAVKCLKASGVAAIVAKSYARIFYRNAINEALPVIECPSAVDYVFQNIAKIEGRIGESEASIDLGAGKVMVDEREFSFPALDSQAMKIFEVGGLVEYTKQLLQEREN
jgi:3-isopropylmalate/(R)-2-methylmalate dehydratase small subunit